MTNAAGRNGTVETVGCNLRLTVPPAFDVAPATGLGFLVSAQYRFSGTFGGQVPFVVVEVAKPGAWALMGLGLIGVGWAAWRPP